MNPEITRERKTQARFIILGFPETRRYPHVRRKGLASLISGHFGFNLTI